MVGGASPAPASLLDRVTRGLRVGIVEGQDWASGTSSRSSKLLHGGLRYLQALDFKLVNEALRSPTAARMRARCTWRTCSPTAPG